MERHRNIVVWREMLQCRFKFFAGKTLKLERRPERPDQRLDPRRNVSYHAQSLRHGWNAGRIGSSLEVFEQASSTITTGAPRPDFV